MSDPLSDLIPINVVAYSLSVTSDEYKAIAAKLKARGLKHFEVWHADGDNKIKSGMYHVETKHLFGDQSNTEEGFRVFDWYDGIFNNNRSWRIGHYIEDGEGWKALQLARRNFNKCGYCGNQEPAAAGTVFCDKCIDSEYLKEGDLHLTRMVCVAESDKKRAPLTEAEKAHLVPLYRAAQLHGTTERGKARIAKARRDIVTKRDAAIKHANVEHDGYLWLMDHGINTANVIYYTHTGKFGFGWRNPVEAGVLTGILDVISEFPFPYEIKCADGRTLEGN